MLRRLPTLNGEEDMEATQTPPIMLDMEVAPQNEKRSTIDSKDRVKSGVKVTNKEAEMVRVKPEVPMKLIIERIQDE
ncbi:uncharacterized protein DS421_4g126540 [Arachis hypogaea]|nr:uncharacterized protein DS421_4g126540 [Arachis hypogaea]